LQEVLESVQTDLVAIATYTYMFPHSHIHCKLQHAGTTSCHNKSVARESPTKETTTRVYQSVGTVCSRVNNYKRLVGSLIV